MVMDSGFLLVLDVCARHLENIRQQRLVTVVTPMQKYIPASRGGFPLLICAVILTTTATKEPRPRQDRGPACGRATHV